MRAASASDIYFDTNEATLTPKSDAALAEMAKLLSDNPDIDVYIVGHTDTVGGYDFNLDLSRRRAQAVVDALVGSHGVSADRVVPAGVGPLAPVASNATGDGQARNRRVELVER
ncbi:OmpA family protein [Roseivivax marinus]|uniref:OmpA family protein n=1 Tax=Roseivivax marinus TaxID=1379903 RepID=UPI0008BFD7B1|nr:OmpA family protein [Roseivivax marinus]SEL17676.1 OmpA family protein [Roseivivax marinus]